LTNTVTADQISAYTDPSRERVDTVAGEVRSYAGQVPRRRAVGSFSASSVWRFTMMRLPYSDVELAREWLNTGVTVLARDHLGQYMYGVFFELSTPESAGRHGYATARWNADITLQYVDFVESV
jgi:hypothetical protein